MKLSARYTVILELFSQAQMAREQSSVCERRIQELEAELATSRTKYEDLQAVHTKCSNKNDSSAEDTAAEQQQPQPIEPKQLTIIEQKVLTLQIEESAVAAAEAAKEGEIIVEKVLEEASEKQTTSVAVVKENEKVETVAENVKEVEAVAESVEAVCSSEKVEEESAKSSSEEISFKLTPEQLAEMFGIAPSESNSLESCAESGTNTTTTTTTIITVQEESDGSAGAATKSKSSTDSVTKLSTTLESQESGGDFFI